MPEKPNVATNQYGDWSNFELVNKVGRGAAPENNEAAAELTRRLMEAVREEAKTAKKLIWLTVTLLVVTVGLLVVGVAQVIGR